ncbi:MAG: c-type cytochrome [Chloroflexi bacterium]|nr:c-type cytochrome [Chloroflexota bacterium]
MMMLMRKSVWMIVIGCFAVLLAACTSDPNPLPGGPTPIPTLIPATMPPVNQPQAEIVLVVESYPVGVPMAESGAALYMEHCTACHGEDGRGLVPNARDFTDVDYMRGETPVSFYTAVTEGHQNVVTDEEMPAFGSLLTSDQRWDVVYYIWRFAALDEALVAGHEIYAATCEDCHGPAGRSMILGAADFSDQEFMSNMSPSDLFVSVTQGRGSMPAWQARLTPEERWAAVNFVRTFTYNPVLPQPTPEAAAGEESTEGGDETAVFVPEPTAIPDELVCDASYLEQSNPYTAADADALANGQVLFDEHCTRCHEENGKGAEGLSYIPPDLTSADVQTALQEDSGKYLCLLSEGFGEMPHFKRKMNDDEIWQVLTYAATLGN